MVRGGRKKTVKKRSFLHYMFITIFRRLDMLSETTEPARRGSYAMSEARGDSWFVIAILKRSCLERSSNPNRAAFSSSRQMIAALPWAGGPRRTDPNRTLPGSLIIGNADWHLRLPFPFFLQDEASRTRRKRERFGQKEAAALRKFALRELCLRHKHLA